MGRKKRFCNKHGLSHFPPMGKKCPGPKHCNLSLEGEIKDLTEQQGGSTWTSISSRSRSSRLRNNKIRCLEVETKGATEFRKALPIYIVRYQQVSWQRRCNAPNNASALGEILGNQKLPSRYVKIVTLKPFFVFVTVRLTHWMQLCSKANAARQFI